MARIPPASGRSRCLFYALALELEPTNLQAKHSLAIRMLERSDPDKALSLARRRPSSRRAKPRNFCLATGRVLRVPAATTKPEPVRASAVRLSEVGRGQGGPQGDTHLGAENRHDRNLAAIDIAVSVQALWAGAAVVLAIVGFLASYYIGEHRTLHVVNGFSQSVEVQVDDEPATTIAPRIAAARVGRRRPSREGYEPGQAD